MRRDRSLSSRTPIAIVCSSSPRYPHGFLVEMKAFMVVQAADARAWSAATVDDSTRWYFPLSPKLLKDLRDVIDAQPTDKPITDILLTDKQLSQWSEAVAPARRDLEEGRGFVIFDHLPI